MKFYRPAPLVRGEPPGQRFRGAAGARPDHRSGGARNPGRSCWGRSSQWLPLRFRQCSANPFGNLNREQRLARLEAVAKLLDVAFILPGTNIRYGIDGIIGLIPVVGDLITTAISLWLVREARALGAPWHITARMLGNVALDGVVGMVPLAGDAFDVHVPRQYAQRAIAAALDGQAAARSPGKG